MENYNGKEYGVYVYSTKTYIEKNWLKIGSTERTFDVRVLEQDVTAVPEPLKIYLTFSVHNYEITPKQLEDKLHDYFDNKGKRLRLDRSREWFYDITIEDVKEAIKAILIDPDAFKLRLELMPHQKEAYNFICDRFDNGARSVLLNHKPRSGKTFICYHLLKEKKYKNVLLLTNYPVLNGQWKNDALNIYGFNYDIINVCSETITEDIMFDERPNFVMVSFQDAKGKSIVEDSNLPMLKDKFKLLRHIKWDLIIVDECHRGKESELTDKLLGHLNFDRLLGLSATPTRNLLRGTFTPNDIHTYSIADEKRYKKLYPELYTLPDISFYLYNPSKAVKAEMQYYKEEENFNWNKFFQVEGGKLKYKNDIEIFFKWISGGYGNGIKAPLKKLDASSILMFVQNNECQPYLVEVLNGIEYYRENYDIYYTNSEVNGSSSELLWKTKNEFIPRHGRKVIVIANRQLTTGITLKKCDMVMFMNEWASMDEYIQACYRCQSPYYDKILKKWKTTCSVVDFTPYRTFKIFKEFIEANYISGNKTLEERYFEFFDSVSLFECNENGEFKFIDLDAFKNRLIDVMDISSRNYFSDSLMKKDIIAGDIEKLLVFGEMNSGLDKGVEEARLDDNGVEKGKTKLIEKTSKDKKDIKNEDDKYRVALENAKYILNKTLFLALFTGCKIDDIGSILIELDKDLEKQKYYIDSLIGVENIAFEDVVYIYKNFFDEYLVNDRIRTFNTKIRNLIYTKNKYERVINIEKVIDLINSYIGVSNIEKKLLGEVFTPFALIEEMLDTLPVEVWSNPDLKWLDPANGIGNFPIVVVKRLMIGLETWQPDEELRYKHILENMLYICELQTKNLFIYLMLFDPNNEYKMNYHRGSFLDEGFDNWMKEKGIEINIIISNPPYQKAGEGRAEKLWPKFISKSVDMIKNDGYILYITPHSWLSGSSNIKKGVTGVYKEYFCKYQLEYVNVGKCDHFFDVSVGFAYFLLKKNKIDNYITKWDTKEGIENFDIRKFDFLPPNMKKLQITINQKVLSRVNNFEWVPLTGGDKGRKDGVDLPENDKIVKTYVRGGNLHELQYAYFNHVKNEKFANKKKVVIPISGAEKFMPFIDIEGIPICISSYLILLNEKDTLNGAISVFNSKLFKFLMQENRSSGFIQIYVVKSLPKIDLSIVWTNDELYKHFNLTDDEIKLIEETIK